MEKVKININSIGVFFGKLFQSRDLIHLSHLSTKSYAAHKALNEYYDSILGLTDDLIEAYQGCYGLVSITIPSSTNTDPVTHLEELKKYIESNKNLIFKESFLLNIIDEILQVIASTLYKLKNLK